MSNTTVTITTNTGGTVPLNTGCVASGANWGWRVGLAAIREAQDFGWKLDSDGIAAVDRFDSNDDSNEDDPEIVSDIVDEALSWLNDNTTGGYWHYWDGDLRLDSDDDPIWGGDNE